MLSSLGSKVVGLTGFEPATPGPPQTVQPYRAVTPDRV
jgi:hypothetical protein